MIKQPSTEAPKAVQTMLPGGGEMGQRIREFPWEATVVDALIQWPPTLSAQLRTILHSGFPMLVLWGKELTCFYNDAFRDVLGADGKHPHILGMPAQKAFPEVWPIVEPLLMQVLQSGVACTMEDIETPFYRGGRLQQVYWTFSYSPIYDESGAVAGVLVVCAETTGKVARLRNLVHQVSSPLVIYSGPDLIVAEANQAILDFWKADRSIVGKPLAEVLPELVEQGFVQLLQDVYHTGKTFTGREVPAFFERADGSRELYYWNLEYNPYRDTDGTISGVIAMATNVTAQVLARKQLTIAEDEMRVALEAANIGYWNVDPVTNILKCNLKTKELFGLPLEDDVDISLAIDNIHPEDRKRVVDRIAEALDFSSGGFYDIEYRVLHPVTGNTAYVRAIGKTYFNEDQQPYRFSGTVQDVTRHKQIEAELRRSEEQYRGLFENMDQGFCIIELIFDDAGEGYDYRFLEYNRRFTEQSGLKDAIGKTMRELVPGIEGHWAKSYGTVATTGRSLRFVEGSDVMGKWFDVYAFRVEDNQSRKVAILFTDITERRRSEGQLAEQQRFNESIIEAAPSITYIYDLVSNQNIFASPQISQILGYSVAEVQAMGSDFLPRSMHPDDIHASQVHLGKLLVDTTGEIYSLEYRMRHRLGHWVWLFERSRVFRRNDAGEVIQVLGVATDITQLKLAEEERIQQQRFTESIIEAAPSLTYIFDLNDSRNMFVSPQITEILGYHKDDITAMGSKVLEQLLHPDDVPAAQARFALILADKAEDIYEVEYRMQHRSGEWVWLFDRARVFKRDALGQPAQMLGVATEITNRKKTEAALQESEGRLRLMADTLPQLVWMADPSGLIQWQNLRNREFFADHDSANSWVQLQHPDDVARTTAVWNDCLRTGAAYEMEYRLFDRRLNAYRWYLVKALPLRNKEGVIVNWFGTYTDIHDHKMMTDRLEALVAERTRELQRSNEDLQQFAHVASHDLKEPVRKIRTFVNLFEKELGALLPPKGNTYLGKMQKAAERMSAMIDGVLRYSSLGTYEELAEPVNLNQLIGEVADDLELIIQQKGALLELAQLPVVSGSSVLLHQLFYNLFNNSLKFTRDGTTPHICVYSDGTERNASGIPVARIVVADNGIGFKAEESERIFGTFIRLHSKDQYEGTGLGLALCQKIVARHGGTIKAEGEAGQGARFIVTLPVNSTTVDPAQ